MNSRICIIASHYLPYLGGVERYVYHLAQGLVKNGFEVDIVTSEMEKEPIYEKRDMVTIYRMPVFQCLAGRYPIIKLNKTFRKIHSILIQQNYNLVIINTRFYFHSVYGVRLAKSLRAKSIIIDHGTGHMSVNNRVLDFIGGVWEHGLTWYEKKYCKDFYAVSKASLEWLRHFKIEGKGVLYNAIDLEMIENLKKKRLRDFRKELGISSDIHVVAFTGRLIKEKGIYQLADAVGRMRVEGWKICAVIAGEGEEENNLRKMKNEAVYLTGKLEFKDVVGLLQMSDIFCLPTNYAEGFPTSTLEAIACRCYVITTGKGGANEVIKNKKYGTIIENNLPDTIAAALKNALRMDTQRGEAIDNAYDNLEENFTWDVTVNHVIQLLEEK